MQIWAALASGLSAAAPHPVHEFFTRMLFFEKARRGLDQIAARDQADQPAPFQIVDYRNPFGTPAPATALRDRGCPRGILRQRTILSW
ncbi:hypothetical protein ACFOFO_14560 [Undibacterium arcticum]|uniref:Uncharacterized protein n=2 Tax=Undibacterium arcticum TaxID=1762892 RepID=A0ABV7F4R7_9BURK